MSSVNALTVVKHEWLNRDCENDDGIFLDQ